MLTKTKSMSNVLKMPLPNGMFTLINSEDLELFNRYKWFVVKSYNNFYVRHQFRIDGKQKIIKLHRMIMGVSDPKIKVDHKNRNTLDNTRSNLRICTAQQNRFNQAPSKGRKYKGVFLDTTRTMTSKRYDARICFNGKKIKLGRYTTDWEAAIAYNKAAKELHGEFAYLNPIIIPEGINI